MHLVLTDLPLRMWVTRHFPPDAEVKYAGFSAEKENISMEYTQLMTYVLGPQIFNLSYFMQLHKHSLFI